MKKVLMLMVLAVIIAVIPACGQSAGNKSASANDGVVKVIYFHGQQRCATCLAVEKTAKEVFDNQFVDEQQNGKLKFCVVDFSKPDGEQIADSYQVAFSSLIIDKDGKVNNLTDIGFRYARSAPDEFKARLAAEILKMLE